MQLIFFQNPYLELKLQRDINGKIYMKNILKKLKKYKLKKRKKNKILKCWKN